MTKGACTTDLSLPTITLGETVLPQAMAGWLSRLLIRRTLNVPALAELTFEAPTQNFATFCIAGVALTIAMPDGRPLFKGTITGQDLHFTADQHYRLAIRAHDALHALRLRHRFRVIEEARLTTLWEEAAAEVGLSFVTGDAGPARRFVQAGESDLAALLAFGADAGLYIAHDGTSLRLLSLAGHDRTITHSWGEKLITARIEKAGERAPRASHCDGWNPYSAKAFSADAALARQDQEIDLASFGLSAMTSDQGRLQGVNLSTSTQDDLAQQAQGAFDLAVARETIMLGTSFLDADLAPGTRLRLEGLGLANAPTGVVTEVIHCWDAAGGATSEFSTAPPPRPERPKAPIVTLGEIIDTDDPEGGGRCKVRLPAFGGLEIGFFSVLIAGAGQGKASGKGAAALPDLGDQVVVLFPQGDLVQGIILGGLYGSLHLPRGTTTKDPRALVLASGGNQRLVLGGAQQMLSLSTHRGDLLQLGGAESKLIVAGNLTIAAVGGTLTIQATKIEFERRGG